MKYFAVTMDSGNYCGFECEGRFAAENEKDLYNNILFKAFLEEMEDFIGVYNHEDEDMEEDYVSVIIEEISQEQYEEEVREFGHYFV